MESKKQKLLLEYLTSSSDIFTLCNGIIKPDYFNPELRKVVRFIQQYYNQYSTTPTPQQILAETDVKLITHDVTLDQVKYTTDQIELFCRQSALEKAILNTPKQINEGNFDEVFISVRDAILVSLQHNLGLRYFDNPHERLTRLLQEDPVEPTGWKELDILLYGGIARKELVLVSANSGGGKSITLANLGFNFIQRGLNVLYVSLELAEDIVAQRYDTMFTGVSRRDWKKHVTEISTKLEAVKDGLGCLDIIQMPSATNANRIEAYLKEYYLHYKMVPDLLILDYIDKMTPNEKMNVSDVWTKDKLVSEQLRDLGVQHNMFTATASQLNREAIKAAIHDHSHIAGGISKINEADIYWSILMNDTMKAAGECTFLLQKTRNSDGDGKSVHLTWVPSHLRIIDRDDDSKIVFKKKQSIPSSIEMNDEENGNKLLDLMKRTTMSS